MSKPAYFIAKAASIDLLSEQVLSLMKEGYVPVGGAFQIFNETQNGKLPVWGQAMVVEEE